MKKLFKNKKTIPICDVSKTFISLDDLMVYVVIALFLLIILMQLFEVV